MVLKELVHFSVGKAVILRLAPIGLSVKKCHDGTTVKVFVGILVGTFEAGLVTFLI
jgi:hypothetical protein